MLTKKILDAIFKRVDGQKFEIEYWDGETKVFNQQLQSDPAFKIIFAEKLSLNEIRKSPQLKMGEAYMDGKINFEGSIKKLIETAGENVFELKEEIEKYKKTADFLLFDTKIGNQTGGTGRSFDWSLIRDLEIPYILAGGLGNENINEALQRLNPAAVDINSRIENEPGKKNHRLLKETVEKIKNFKPRTEAKLKLKSKQ